MNSALKFYVIATITVSLILLICLIASAEVHSDEYYNRVADAIYIIEGGERANQLYGINPKYVYCGSEVECRRVCINTIKSKEREWLNNGEVDFLTYLSKRYCPPNHRVWLKNLKFYLRRG